MKLHFSLKMMLALCIILHTESAFSQELSNREKIVNIWEYRGVRMANSKENFSEDFRNGMYKIFFANGTFKNVMFLLPNSVTTSQGKYEIVNDSVFKEILMKTDLKSYPEGKVTEMKYHFVSDKTLLIQYKTPTGFNAEEKWVNLNFKNEQNQVSLVATTELEVFSDPLLSKIKKNVSDKQIEAITNVQLKNLAQQLKKKSYKTDYRIAEFRSKLSPTALGRELSIGDGYSRYEHITGIYLPEGENVIVVDNLPDGKKINIVVPDWERRAPKGVAPDKDPAGWGLKRKVYPVANGANLVNIEKAGLVYVDYFSEKPENDPAIKIHFVNGQVNGYFDIEKHNDKDWNKFLDNAIYPIIDAVGKHIQIGYPVEACKKYAYGRGVELIKNYDLLIKRQYEIMGLEKYNRVPKNKILSRVNYNYYMFRDSDGVAYMGARPGYAMAMVTKPESVIKGDPCWGFSHEVGHVHQLRPYFNWGGTHEVSNNIYTLYVTTSFGNKSRIMEQDNYKKAKKSIIERNLCYLQDSDVFNRLVPFWQLHLYFKGVGKNPDFYPDLFEAFRKQAEIDNKTHLTNNPAHWQINFVKTACDVSKTDLTDFFDKYGFFYVGELLLQDYGSYRYALSQEVVDEAKKYIRSKNYPKPKIDISELTDENWKNF